MAQLESLAAATHVAFVEVTKWIWR